MARFIPIVFALALCPAPTLAQSAKFAARPMVAEEPRPEPSFDIPDEPANSVFPRPDGSRIIAGTELIPNSTIGFGLFGEKSEQTAHAPATARDFTLPKTRKAAVGFSLKF